MEDLSQEEEKYIELITESEIDDIIKIINKKYPNGIFPYHQTYDVILEYKIENLKNGLMEVFF